MEVLDRTSETLEGIIMEWVQPGTRIMPDGWASYYNLKNIHGGIHSHDVVIHERHFVNPEDPTIHTPKYREQIGQDQEEIQAAVWNQLVHVLQLSA